MSLIPKNNGKIIANPHDNRYNIERLRRRDAIIELAINKMKERVRKISQTIQLMLPQGMRLLLE